MLHNCTGRHVRSGAPAVGVGSQALKVKALELLLYDNCLAAGLLRPDPSLDRSCKTTISTVRRATETQRTWTLMLA